MKEESGPLAPDSIGTVLRARRLERGLTLAQASATTRLRIAHLSAIEADDLDRLPAPVYARGYVRTYAAYLGIDPESVLPTLPHGPSDSRRLRELGVSPDRRRIVLTAPAAAVTVVALLASGFTFYAWRQVSSLSAPATPTSHVAAAPPSIPTSTPLPPPSPQPRPIVVGVHVTDTVWLSVTVDGRSQYSDSGRILQPGSEVYFTGLDIKITSGKGAATLITVDERSFGPMGNGVITREFKAT